MNTQKVINVTLWILLAIGFLGAFEVSYSNLMGNPCPHIWVVPICYVVLAAYGSMIASVLIRHNGCKHYFFCAGWGTAFVIALLASIAELIAGGGVCPASGGGLRGASSASVPLCFISLALTIAILILFIIGPYRRACDSHEARMHS